jgi:calcium-dependent protein kinase
MLFEMLANELPFKNIPCTVSEGQVYWGHTGRARVAEPPWSKLAHASGQGKDLCREMMVFSRQRRPTASQCLQAKFFCMNDTELAVQTQSVVPIEELSPAIVERLSTARSRNALKRSVSLSIARRWPSNQLPSIKRAFEALDVDGTGRLRKDHVIASLVEAGLVSNVAREIVEAMDLDRNGLVDWTEFVSSCIDLGDRSLEKDLRQLFNNADQDGDGLLSASDVGSLLIVEHLSKGDAARDAVDGIIADSNASARIDWKQFREYFQNQTSRKANAKSNEGGFPHIGNVVTFDQFQQMMSELWQWALGTLQSNTLPRNQLTLAN